MFGIKLIVECANGVPSTWHDRLTERTSIAQIIKENIEQKGWENGTFKEVYLEYTDSDNKYHKIQIDIKKMKLNELLKV